MLKTFLFIFLLIPSIVLGQPCKDCHAVTTVNINEEVIITAKKFLYVREKTNNNDAPEIDLWLKNCGLGKGYSYCAAYSVYMYKLTFEQYMLKSPFPNTAGVASFAQYCTKHPFDFKVISIKKLKWGIDIVEPGDILSFKHGTSAFSGWNYMGHQGINIIQEKESKVLAIEGNTKPSNKGDQSGTVKGDMKTGQEGVYIRQRSFGTNSNFPIIYAIRLNKRIYNVK